MKKINNKLTRIVTFKDYVGELTATYRRTSVPTVAIKSSLDAYNFIYPYFDEIMDDHEQVKVIHLNNNSRVVNVHHASTGTDKGTTVPINHIMRNALIIQTQSIIMVHNHPSGNLKFSIADKNISKQLKKACEIMQIQFLDSLVVTRESYASMMDHGDIL